MDIGDFMATNFVITLSTTQFKLRLGAADTMSMLFSLREGAGISLQSFAFLLVADSMQQLSIGGASQSILSKWNNVVHLCILHSQYALLANCTLWIGSEQGCLHHSQDQTS